MAAALVWRIEPHEIFLENRYSDDAMTTYFISRHLGALEWLNAQHIAVDRQLSHLEGERLEPGDRVIGTLPVHLAWHVCQQGAEYWHLTLDMPAEWRGRELNAEQMQASKARLERFVITRLPERLLP